MVNMENLKHVIALGGILLGIEVLGNKLSNAAPDDVIIIVIAATVVGLGLYFHVIRG